MSAQEWAVEAEGLTMRYGRRRAPVLVDCGLTVPTGSVCGLVGPNGAGKSTLLALAAGLLRPTSGVLKVLGSVPPGARADVAYVAQAKPLPSQLTVAAVLRLGAELNRSSGRWSAAAAESIAYEQGGLHPKARIHSLSGGQRTRVALALAFGKRARLMLLDEPMADLDPVARGQLMGALMASAAEEGTTIVMSSHVLPELESTCDQLVLLGDGRVRLAGPVDELVSSHVLLTGSGSLSGHRVVEQRPAGRGATALVRRGDALPPGWEAMEPSLQEIVLAHLRTTGSSAPALPAPASSAPEETTA
ncbi:ABC transporter ATP-binding protein [Streptomyces sp. TRM66268-LWL]|uniref:ABC transporter ATP-binding protein n=1 Tax=Streptomyces polyasparticus TaxID=2767826 RepID=A0ABR7SWA5_9ACTN|nr:ABC transporter ATP-binding protein [Streptomyces polyasparticus]MBC9719174.1 ABC transporter ATP-binding protein [Streptomyces polyasparticus]